MKKKIIDLSDNTIFTTYMSYKIYLYCILAFNLSIFKHQVVLISPDIGATARDYIRCHDSSACK